MNYKDCLMERIKQKCLSKKEKQVATKQYFSTLHLGSVIRKYLGTIQLNV